MMWPKSLFLLLLVAVHAEKKSLLGDGLSQTTVDDSLLEEKNESKRSEKRWSDQGELYPPQSKFSKELSTLNVQSRGEGQERAKEERTFKDFPAYEAIQSVLLNALKPKPIVDTAEDSEKFALNEGSKTLDFIVKGSETLSRALNTAIDVPKKAISKLSSGATQVLNQLGAYLVGL